jgi:DNA polymerase-3 subunit delta
MNIQPDSLVRQLQDSLACVYLVAGAEPLLVQESRDLILATARQQGFVERQVYQAGSAFDWDLIHHAAAEQSLFSSRKVIDVRLPGGKPGKDGGRFFSDWAGAPDPDRLLIVSCEEWDTASRKSRWATDLAAAGVAVEIWPVKARDLPKWISRRMRLAGLQADEEAVMLLADLVEGNLLAAQQEIDKLALLMPGGQVSADVVHRAVANNARFDAFRLNDCLLGGQAADCLKVASGLRRSGVAIQAIGGALYYQVNQLDAVRCALRSGESEARVFGRLRIFRMAQPLLRMALKRLSGRQIGDAFRSLALMDRQSKGRAAGDPWQTLDQMLLALCAAPGKSGPAKRAHG